VLGNNYSRLLHILPHLGLRDHLNNKKKLFFLVDWQEKPQNDIRNNSECFINKVIITSGFSHEN